MRHLKKGKILDRQAAARKALLKNLAQNLIIYEKIKTTNGKARAVQPLVEQMITVGKNNNLTNRRKLLKKIYINKAVRKIFEVLGPRYKDRHGGYTRIIKLGQRKGDGAEMVQIEFV